MAQITGTIGNDEVNIDGAATEDTLQNLVESINRLTGVSTGSLKTGTILLRRGPTEDRMPFVPLKGEIIYDNDLEQVFIGNSIAFGGKSVFGDKIQVDSTTGNLTTTDNITLGADAESDTVQFTARVDSNIEPTSDDIYDLGSSQRRWGTVYASSLVIEDQNTSTPSGTTIAGDLTVESLGADDIVAANITATNNLTTTGVLTVGDDAETDTVEFQARVNSSVEPISDDTYDLGSAQRRWRTVYASSLVIEDQDPLTPSETTIAGDFTVETLTATDITSTDLNTDNLNVDGKISVNGNVLANTVNGNSIGLGVNSLGSVTGSNNVALGNSSLSSVTSGSDNTAVGRNAGSSLQGGSNNLLLGNSASASGIAANNEITLGNLGIERLRVPGLGIDYTATGSFKTPAGTTAERSSATTGAIRFNTDKTVFEGFNGSNWVGLGSVSDDDQDTFIKTEDSLGDDQDSIEFITGGQTSATLDQSSLSLSTNNTLRINSTVSTSGLGTGAVVVSGGVSIAGDLVVAGQIVNAGIERTNSISAQGTASAANQTSSVVVSSADIEAFDTNGSVRIFNASIDTADEPITGLGFSLARVGFTEPQSGDSVITFDYRLAQFDFETGKISPATAAQTIDILDTELVTFNNTNNIQLTISRNSTSKGILVYRKIGSQTSHRLIAVLGPKEFGNATANLPWTDYYNFDLSEWSGKDVTNSFTAAMNLEHFPLNPSETALNGWIDTTITGVSLATNTISVADAFYTTGIVQVYNDDTADLQSQIDLNADSNVNSLRLDTRTYFISQLVLPDGFSLEGGGEQTQLVKLPWSTTTTTNSNEMIIVDPAVTSPTQLTIKSMTLDGNFINQYLADDSSQTSASLNYAITIYGSSLIIDSIEITNSIGGGIYLYDPNLQTDDVYVSQNKINDGTLTLRYDYSPLVATEASDITIIQNNFTNFSDYVDVSAVERGVVNSNIINNCGSGLYGFGTISTILNPNVLVGPAGEFLPNPDILNSEFDSVNVVIEPDVNFTSPVITYTESGQPFDLTANQGTQTGLINELLKVNGVETIGTDYSTTTSGTEYISFDNSVAADQGEIQWKIQESLVNDLLSRASYDQLFNANSNSVGLIYRIVQTEYVPQTTISGGGSDQGSNIYRIPVLDASMLNVNDIVRLVNHNSTPSLADVDGEIVNINNITNEIDIDLGLTVTSPGNQGSVALKNNFVVVKGKIN